MVKHYGCIHGLYLYFPLFIWRSTIKTTLSGMFALLLSLSVDWLEANKETKVYNLLFLFYKPFSFVYLRDCCCFILLSWYWQVSVIHFIAILSSSFLCLKTFNVVISQMGGQLMILSCTSFLFISIYLSTSRSSWICHSLLLLLVKSGWWWYINRLNPVSFEPLRMAGYICITLVAKSSAPKPFPSLQLFFSSFKI